MNFLISDFSVGINWSDKDQIVLDSIATEVFVNLDSLEENKKERFDTLLQTELLNLDSNKNYEQEYYPEYLNKGYSYNSKDSSTISIEITEGWLLTSNEWKKFIRIKDIKSLSNQQIFDSLHVEYKTPYTQRVIRQIIKIYTSDKEYVFAFVTKNFSLMMFLMLPVFALILKVLYIRRKILYINHLVHTIHIHSFAFLVYGLSIAVIIYFFDNYWVSIIAVLLVTIYNYFSFKTVYNQNHKKTLLKFFFTGLIYSFFMLVAFLIELFLSFLIF